MGRHPGGLQQRRYGRNRGNHDGGRDAAGDNVVRTAGIAVTAGAVSGAVLSVMLIKILTGVFDPPPVRERDPAVIAVWGA